MIGRLPPAAGALTVQYLRGIGAALALVMASSAGSADSPTEAPPEQPTIPDQIPIVLLVDLGSGQTLLAREADRRFIPASITKIMSAYVAFEMLDAGKLSADQMAAMSSEAHENWYQTGSTMFLRQGEEVSIDTLLFAITSVSANDAAAVLAETGAGSVDEWVAEMNRTARSLGMRNSHFGTPNGWPDGGKTFTTARDLERLSRALITRHPEKFARYFGQPGFAYNGVTQANRDPISGKFPGADGIKTGFTRQAGNGFVGTAERYGKRLLSVVGAAESTLERDQLTRDMIAWGFDGFTETELFVSGDPIGNVRVQNGMAGNVAVVTAGPVKVNRAIGEGAEMELTLRYEGPLKAPIAAGEQVAHLEIAVEGMAPFRVPLVARDDVAEAGLGQRLLNGISGIIG